MTTAPLVPGSQAHCDHCDRKGADFSFKGSNFCCECMASLTSWILDGGMVEEPDLFSWVLDDTLHAYHGET